MRNPLTTVTQSGTTISQSRIEEMYALRLTIFTLKAGTDPEKDWKKFEAYARASQYVFMFLDAEGKVQGFYFFKYSQQEIQHTKYILLEPEYGFFSKKYRKHPGLAISFAKVTFALMLRFPFRKIYLAGVAYPASYLRIRKCFSNFWDLDSALPSFERAVFTQFSTSISTPEEITKGTGTMPTIPEPYAGQGKHSPWMMNYEHKNPNWRMGEGLKVLCQVRLIDFVQTACDMAKAPVVRMKERISTFLNEGIRKPIFLD